MTTKNDINKKVDKSLKTINDKFLEERNSLQNQVNTHVDNTKKTLDGYFTNLAKQVTTSAKKM